MDILSGLVAGNFSGFWLGIIIVALMGASFLVSGAGSGLGDMGVFESAADKIEAIAEKIKALATFYTLWYNMKKNEKTEEKRHE